MPVSIFRTTPDGDILIANKALVEMLEYPDQKELRKVNAAIFYENPRKCIFRSKAVSDSDSFRPPVPVDSGHFFPDSGIGIRQSDAG